MRQELEFLSVEPKNGIREHTDTHGSKQIGFITGRKYKALSIDTEPVKSPPRWDLKQFLHPFLNHFIISNQSI